MPDYSQTQIDQLQSYIDSARSALAAGDAGSIKANISNYYTVQVDKRGYASSAVQVVNNQGVFGATANNLLSDALGAQQYGAMRGQIMINLAASDLQTIRDNGGNIPTIVQVENYHFDDYQSLGIPVTVFGGSAAAALGANPVIGPLKAGESASGFSPNKFSNLSANDVAKALYALQAAGFEAAQQVGFSDASGFINGALYYNGLTTLFQSKFYPGVSSFRFGDLAPPQSGSNQYVEVAPVTATAADGSTLQEALGYDPNGTPQNEIVAITPPQGPTEAGVTGQEAIFNLNNAVATVTPGSSVSDGGSNNEFRGNNINMNFESGSSGRLIGDFDKTTLAPGSAAAIVGQNETIDAQYATLNLGAGTTASVASTGSTINMAENSGAVATISGSATATGDSGSNAVGLLGVGTSVTVEGSGSVSVESSGENLTLENAGATVGIATGVQGETITGSGDTVIATGQVTGSNVDGSNMTLDLVANSGSAIGLVGQEEVVNGADGNLSVLYGSGSSATVNGTGTIDVQDSSQYVNLANAGATADLANGVQGETIVGSGDYVVADGQFTGSNVYGQNMVVDLQANSGSSVGLIGQGETVNGADGNFSVLYGSGSSATVNGTGTIDVQDSSQYVNLANAGATADLANGVQGETIVGSGDYVVADGQFTGSNVYGQNMVVDLQANSGSSVGLIGQGETVNGADGNFSVLYGYGNSATVNGTGGTQLEDSGETLIRNTAGGGIYLSDNLSGETIYANGASVYEGYNDQVRIVGSQDTFFGNASDSTNYDGYNYDGSGGYGYGDDGGGGGGYGGGYGYYGGFGAAGKSSTAGADLGSIAAYDRQFASTPQEASAADRARTQASAALAATGLTGAATTPVFDGPRWMAAPTTKTGDVVVTWSFASDGTDAANPFSGYVSDQYKSTVESAMQAWSSASGLHLQEVGDSAASDIRVGWGSFDTQDSNVLGYTSFTSTGASINPGAIVRIEDPGITPLVSANGYDTFAGTDATLYQTALHEIGHALGFADDADPMSIMYPLLSSSNRTLDQTDINGAQIVYGSSSQNQADTSATSDRGGLGRMLEAMASFGVQPSSLPTPLPDGQSIVLAQQLSAPLHHA